MIGLGLGLGFSNHAAMSAPPPLPYSEPFSLGSNNSSSADPTVITTVAAAPVGSLVVVSIAYRTVNTAVVTDSAENSWTMGPERANSTRRVRQGFSIITNEIPAEGTISVDFSGSGNNLISALCMTGASALDHAGAGFAGTATDPGFTTAAFSAPNAIIFPMVYVDNGDADTFTPDPAFTTEATLSRSGMGRMWVGSKVLSATDAITVDPTNSVARNWSGQYLAFVLAQE